MVGVGLQDEEAVCVCVCASLWPSLKLLLNHLSMIFFQPPSAVFPVEKVTFSCSLNELDIN